MKISPLIAVFRSNSIPNIAFADARSCISNLSNESFLITAIWDFGWPAMKRSHKYKVIARMFNALYFICEKGLEALLSNFSSDSKTHLFLQTINAWIGAGTFFNYFSNPGLHHGYCTSFHTSKFRKMVITSICTIARFRWEPSVTILRAIVIFPRVLDFYCSKCCISARILGRLIEISACFHWLRTFTCMYLFSW